MVTVWEEKIWERLGDLLSKAEEIVNQLDEANATLDEIDVKLEVLDDMLVQINVLIDLIEDIKVATAATLSAHRTSTCQSRPLQPYGRLWPSFRSSQWHSRPHRHTSTTAAANTALRPPK